MPSLQAQPLKSIHHELHSYLVFVNRTNTFIDVVWVNYQGQFIRYIKRLPPGGRKAMDTYVTHPWIAWNSDTQDRVNLNSRDVFYPQPYQGEEQRTVVFLDRPMLPLLDICLQKVRSLVRTEDVELLEIPRDLFRHLKEKQTINVDESPH